MSLGSKKKRETNLFPYFVPGKVNIFIARTFTSNLKFKHFHLLLYISFNISYCGIKEIAMPILGLRTNRAMGND